MVEIQGGYGSILYVLAGLLVFAALLLLSLKPFPTQFPQRQAQS